MSDGRVSRVTASSHVTRVTGILLGLAVFIDVGYFHAHYSGEAAVVILDTRYESASLIRGITEHFLRITVFQAIYIESSTHQGKEGYIPTLRILKMENNLEGLT